MPETTFDPPPAAIARRRRSQAEVVRRIVEAARVTFTDIGYSAATTRAIAARAQVSETLLFRHFGTKSSLFDHVVFAPFDDLADAFLTAHEAPDTPHAADRDFLGAFLAFLDAHRVLLTMLAVKGMAETDDERSAARQARMRALYARATALLGRGSSGVAPDLSVRLGFGMILASSLFAEWLFPDGPPDRESLIEGIDDMISKALVPGSTR